MAQGLECDWVVQDLLCLREILGLLPASDKEHITQDVPENSLFKDVLSRVP